MFNRELVKGSTSLLVLQLLNERDMYGYELVKEMDRRSENHLQMKEGTLYPALHKMEKQAYIECYWQNQEKGPARKYYRITEQGKEILAERTSEWHRYVQVMNNLIGRNES
ncbi:PadR family transcriptional regulator [Oceanobacillus profundus]|uniref:PadR family transcriptional regulator n=1 Tax=Oceanobacillus profundus TaxID=372463 RepID=A0A417YI33_9BACI|nr:PadR family transcriptional regulator [Oceanobacillus profundus]MBR3121745.1 PadR family transcriptional regulator [Oceanobacillus sp.]PAE28166.1 PadR family transcriptional regulator [Paenibacillus sp. 7884-2]MCM3399797.1 PadR family transcriptional regulator [Oceanobacillus profundus]MDO6449952.1 PadR family transcriptional regulator [Oceanobacillus profundus]RHW32606.1 PadR family transcriptional regulator [Oceanobacillus profundus]